ncbi:hypothetical protein CH365_14500 [Leptospira neocaledonica]|uniref:Uncharacterized protein n=1 Tax=Leptospira neocaledonica TaxID=2023192 RepID=A0A2M9ZX42_9LEPT|nr:hypothetical protein CH365_14500 [Leptospira neocaledonica]
MAQSLELQSNSRACLRFAQLANVENPWLLDAIFKKYSEKEKMKLRLIIISSILSIIIWGLILAFFVLNSGNLIIEEGTIEKLPKSYVASTYIHIGLLIFLAIFSIKRKYNYRQAIVFFAFVIMPNFISFVVLSFCNSFFFNMQKYSLNFVFNWNYTDIVFYLFLYFKALSFN